MPGPGAGLEAATTWRVSNAELDDFKDDAAFHGCGLFSHPDFAEAAFADFLEEFVRADR